MKSVVHSRIWMPFLSSSLLFLATGCDKLERAAGLAPNVAIVKIDLTPNLTSDNECIVHVTNKGEGGFVTLNFSDDSGYQHLYKAHVDKTGEMQTITFPFPGQSVLKARHYQVEVVSESME